MFKNSPSLRELERCEWNPEFNRAAETGYDCGACTNAATVNVGANGKWHLCESCAGLPAFKRFRKRTPLPTPKRLQPLSEASAFWEEQREIARTVAPSWIGPFGGNVDF